MGIEPCAKLKSLVEVSLQGLVRSTRCALRQAPQVASDSTWASELFGEFLNTSGLWEHHMGAEMMSRAYAVPQDVGYRERATEPILTPEVPSPTQNDEDLPPQRRNHIAETDEEWLLCSDESGGSHISESDWTVLAQDELIEMA